MTDARLPERWLMDRRIVRLTPAERSSYFMAILWTVSNRTDGRIDKGDLALIPTFDMSAVPRLVDVGLWSPKGGGWVDEEFKRVQSSRDDLETLERARASDRRKHARQRSHKAGDHSGCTPDTCDYTGTVPGTRPGDHIGKAGQAGQAGLYGEPSSVDQSTGEVTGWATTTPGRVEDDYCKTCGQSAGRHTGSCKAQKKEAA